MRWRRLLLSLLLLRDTQGEKKTKTRRKKMKKKTILPLSLSPHMCKAPTPQSLPHPGIPLRSSSVLWQEGVVALHLFDRCEPPLVKKIYSRKRKEVGVEKRGRLLAHKKKRRTKMATARGVRFAESQSSFRDEGAAGSDAVVKEFHESLARAPEMAVAVAAIKVKEGRKKSFDRDIVSGGGRQQLSLSLSLDLDQVSFFLVVPPSLTDQKNAPLSLSLSLALRQQINPKTTGPHRRHQALPRHDDDGHRAGAQGGGRDARALQRDGHLAEGRLRAVPAVRDEDERAGAARL